MKTATVILAGAALIAPLPVAAQAPISHSQKIVHPSWFCDVNWDQNCEDSETVVADNGWQVCRAIFNVTTSDGHDAWFHADPAQFYPGDPESPDRFGAIAFTIHGYGNGNPLDQRGSKEVVENVGIDMIPASANNYGRDQEHCTMPAHD